MRDERRVKVGLRRDGQLQHDLLPLGDRIHALRQLGQQDLLGLGLVGGLDVHLGLEDRHQPLVEHLEAQVDLLRHDIGDARGVRGVDDRAFLGAEDAMCDGPVQQLRQARNGLHHLHAVDLVLQALVDLEEGDDALVLPQVAGRGLAADLAVHRHLEQDRADHLVTGETGRGGDARAHGVDQVEHLGLGGILILLDAVEAQRLGRRSPRLVQRGDEALAGFHLGSHGVVRHSALLGRWGVAPLWQSPARLSTMVALTVAHPACCSASTPGRVLPSIHSRKAPPAVET